MLIDDEELAIATLVWQLEEFCPEVEVVKTFTSPSVAYDYLAVNSGIDLCFLDIDMPEMSGFDFLRKWQQAPPFDVIFATAYNEFAIKAFKVSAFDYLLKPIDEEELIGTIEKYTDKIASNDLTSKLDMLYQQLHLSQQAAYPTRISLPTREGIHLVDVDKIIRLEAFKNYTSVYAEGKSTIVVSKTIKDMERLLNPDLFMRVHQSHVVNWKKISTYQRGQGGSLILEDGSIIPVSKNKKHLVLDKINA